MIVNCASKIGFFDLSDFVEAQISKQVGEVKKINIMNVRDGILDRNMEFTITLKNGKVIHSLVKFVNFECTIAYFDNNTKNEFSCNRAWAKFVYKTLKKIGSIDSSMLVISEEYKKDYNEHVASIKAKKVELAKKEYEQNILK